MRIAVDGYELHGGFTGVGRYLRSLLKNLLKAGRENSYTLFLREPLATPWESETLETRVLSPSRGGYTLWQNQRLRPALDPKLFDLFWSPNYNLPLSPPLPSLLTVHDVSWKALPEDYTFRDRILRDLKSRLSFPKARKIFTDSSHGRGEILRFYPSLPPEKVYPVPLGIEESFHPASAEEVTLFRRRYNLKASRVLGFLGTFFPRRHVGALISVLPAVRRECDVELLLVGRNADPSLTPEVLSSSGVRWIDRLDEAELNSFYSTLSLFLYPSSYEGFGFPPMEALCCGTPPLLLSGSSLEEYLTGCSLFLEEAQPEKISRMILDYLDHEEDRKRSLLSRWNLMRPCFTWERTAKEYLPLLAP